jgi:hypothetical protein
MRDGNDPLHLQMMRGSRSADLAGRRHIDAAGGYRAVRRATGRDEARHRATPKGQ